jgi:hypothetical protein
VRQQRRFATALHDTAELLVAVTVRRFHTSGPDR